MGWLCSNHNIELYEIRHAYSVLSISLIGFCIFPSIHVLYDLCSHVCMLVFFFLGGGVLQFMLVFILSKFLFAQNPSLQPQIDAFVHFPVDKMTTFLKH